MTESLLARWPDFLELTKPRVVALMLITAVIGMCMAVPGLVPWQPLVLGNIGIAFCAGAAAAINHVVDERIDQKMSRTTNRPVAQGRVSQSEAIVFAALLAILGTVLLAATINVLTAVLTVASLVGYAFIYTMFLKRATPQNIVIGGLAGAAPPYLVGPRSPVRFMRMDCCWFSLFLRGHRRTSGRWPFTVRRSTQPSVSPCCQ